MCFGKVIKDKKKQKRKTWRKSHVRWLSPIEISFDINKNVQYSKCHMWSYFPIKIPGNIYLFEVNSKNIRKRCEMQGVSEK